MFTSVYISSLSLGALEAMFTSVCKSPLPVGALDRLCLLLFVK